MQLQQQYKQTATPAETTTARGNREEFLDVLDKVPDVEPEKNDRS